MLRFDLKLLPLDEVSNEAEAKIITESNDRARHSCRHLEKLLGNKKCRKHPSTPNKIRVSAVKGGDPTAEMITYCCADFLKQIK